MSLTVKQALFAKPGRHSDGEGLYLLVQPTGTKSWVLRVQHNGRRRDFGLGKFVAEPVGVDIVRFPPISDMGESLLTVYARPNIEQSGRTGRA